MSLACTCTPKVHARQAPVNFAYVHLCYASYAIYCPHHRVHDVKNPGRVELRYVYVIAHIK